MPPLFNDFQSLLGVMMLERARQADVHLPSGPNIFRIAVIQVHSVPFAHPERRDVCERSCPKSLIHETRECNLVSIIADGSKPGWLAPGSREENYLSGYRPRCESDDGTA